MVGVVVQVVAALVLAPVVVLALIAVLVPSTPRIGRIACGAALVAGLGILAAYPVVRALAGGYVGIAAGGVLLAVVAGVVAFERRDDAFQREWRRYVLADLWGGRLPTTPPRFAAVARCLARNRHAAWLAAGGSDRNPAELTARGGRS
jgi:hypothetical protein